MPKAKEPFHFHTRLTLTELTGVKANNIKELLEHIKEASDACIYHHTHHFLQQHLFLTPEPPNDFAYWIKEVLGKPELSEQLASIDIIDFVDIKTLRDTIVKKISDYLEHNPDEIPQNVSRENTFHFMRSVSFVFPSKYIAKNVTEFLKIIKKISIDSIYFHIFESRLRLRHDTNDFANWFDFSLNDKQTAAELSKIDPYTYTLEELREKIIHIIKENHYGKS
jgi:hypothetical protein